MRYGELISQAFRITWRNRYLWFFGLFAGSTSIGFQGNFSTDTDSLDVDPAVIIAVAAVILVLFVVYVLLGSIAQGGLADSVAAIARGERRGFGSTWRAGASRFWRVLGYGALLFLVGPGLFLAVAVPLGAIVAAGFLLTDSVVVHVFVLLPAGLAALVALLALALPFPAIAQFGLRALVLEGERLVGSLRRGWRIFRGNIGKSLLLILIQQGIGFGVAIVLVVAAFALIVPVVILVVLAPAWAAIALGAVEAVVVVPLALALFGALGAFNHALWTLAYLQLVSAPQPWPPAAPA